MKKVTYRGTATRTTISAEQFKAVGVNSADAEWNGYGDTVELADAAADYLAKHDERFEVDGADDSAYNRRLKADPDEQLRRVRTGESVHPDMLAQTSEQERRALQEAQREADAKDNK